MRRGLGLLAALALLLCSFGALADEAGVLSESELNEWLRQVLADSLQETPLNAPVGEESLTEDGYAFLYSFATLYYDKPTLDEASVLQAVSVTGEGYATPRGIALGGSDTSLEQTYGWQNPYLMGYDALVPFYLLNNLPTAAYWSWATLDEHEQVSSVRCAIHVRLDNGLYTDASLVYTLADGVITDIRAYGLTDVASEAEVVSNVNAVLDAQVAGGLTQAASAAGYTTQSNAAMFSADDLAFGGLDYARLTPDAARALLGEPASEATTPDDTGDTLISMDWPGVSMSFARGAGGENRLETVSVTDESLVGPRGVRVGAALADVLAAFCADGEGRVTAEAALLYGDGVNPPYALLEAREGNAILRYVTLAADTAVTLWMTFNEGRLAEFMVYSW